MTMFTLKDERALAAELALNVRVADVTAPLARILVEGVHVIVRYEAALEGLQAEVLIDRVSATLPVFFR